MRSDGLRPRLHEHKAARTIGVFDHTRRCTHLAEQRGVLISGNAADGQRRGQEVGCCFGIDLTGSTDCGQHGSRNRQDVE